MRVVISPKQFFVNLHNVEVNHFYDKNECNLPYSFHLDMVRKQFLRFKYLIDSKDYNTVEAGCYGHDSIEDARITYNDIKGRFGEQIAEIIFLCSEHTGRTPADRKPIEFYKALATNELAAFVKLCDIMANALYSVMSYNNGMLNKSKTTYFEKVKVYMYLEKYKDMYDYLEQIYLLNPVK